MKYKEALRFLSPGCCIIPFKGSLVERIKDLADQDIDPNNGLSLEVTGAITTKVHRMLDDTLRASQALQMDLKNMEIGIPSEILGWFLECIQTEGSLRDEVSILWRDQEVAPVFIMATLEAATNRP